jgi:glutamate formiminotransferase
VLTVVGDESKLPQALAELAAASSFIDLTRQIGVHPRIGRLDVCPIVYVDGPAQRAVRVAHATGEAVNTRTGLPVYFYGEAAYRSSTRELPALRAGGLAKLARRALSDLPPDLGSRRINLRAGVVCVGARGVLIAFNVWLRCPVATAREIAGKVRTTLPGVRALGLEIDNAPTSQVSMNLIDPPTTGIEDAFDFVAAVTKEMRCAVLGTEIVGLVPQRFMPGPDAKAARMLITPGRSLESALN